MSRQLLNLQERERQFERSISSSSPRKSFNAKRNEGRDSFPPIVKENVKLAGKEEENFRYECENIQFGNLDDSNNLELKDKSQ